MSPPPFPAPKYLPGKTYTPLKTTSTSATTSPPTQQPSTSTSPPPTPARSPGRVPAPAPTFCPIVETPALPPKATKTSPIIHTLPPPPAQQFDQKAWADEDYPELIDDTLDAEYDYHYQARPQIGQDAPRRYFSFSNTTTLRAIPEENQEVISAFADVKSPARPEKWSAPLPSNFSKWTIKGDDGKEDMKEGIEPVTKDQGEVKKENLPFRPAKKGKNEDESGEEDDEEKRFI